MMSENSLPSNAKLAWMCRRGLLELDLILQKIVKEQYADWNDDEKLLFCDFLDTPDTQLLRYLLGQDSISSSDNTPMARLLQKMISL